MMRFVDFFYAILVIVPICFVYAASRNERMGAIFSDATRLLIWTFIISLAILVGMMLIF